MPIEFPEPLKNFGFDNDDHMEKWLNQFATVTNEMPKERCEMLYYSFNEKLYVKNIIVKLNQLKNL